MEKLPQNLKKNDGKENQTDKLIVKNKGEAMLQIWKKFKKEQKENYFYLDFHNEKHPEIVRKKALEFAKIIMRADPNLVSKDTLLKIVGSAASHDSVLNMAHGAMITRFRGFFDADIPENLRIMMNERGILKGNELLSAEWLENELDLYVAIDGTPIFDPESKVEMINSIAATFPEFNFAATIQNEDFEKYFGGVSTKNDLNKYRTGIKVWQPHLKSESSIDTLAVATGDLRSMASSDNFEDYRQSGNEEFRELNLGLKLKLEKGIETIPTVEKSELIQNILKWVKSQITFAMWQKILFWESIDKNELISKSEKSLEIKQALKERYDSNFDANVLKAKQRYEHLEEKYGKITEREEEEFYAKAVDDSFRELLYEMGFSSTPEN